MVLPGRCSCGMRPAVPGDGFHAGKPTDRTDGTAVVRSAFAPTNRLLPNRSISITASRPPPCQTRRLSRLQERRARDQAAEDWALTGGDPLRPQEALCQGDQGAHNDVQEA